MRARRRRWRSECRWCCGGPSLNPGVPSVRSAIPPAGRHERDRAGSVGHDVAGAVGAGPDMMAASALSHRFARRVRTLRLLGLLLVFSVSEWGAWAASSRWRPTQSPPPPSPHRLCVRLGPMLGLGQCARGPGVRGRGRQRGSPPRGAEDRTCPCGRFLPKASHDKFLFLTRDVGAISLRIWGSMLTPVSRGDSGAS